MWREPREAAWKKRPSGGWREAQPPNLQGRQTFRPIHHRLPLLWAAVPPGSVSWWHSDGGPIAFGAPSHPRNPPRHYTAESASDAYGVRESARAPSASPSLSPCATSFALSAADGDRPRSLCLCRSPCRIAFCAISCGALSHVPRTYGHKYECVDISKSRREITYNVRVGAFGDGGQMLSVLLSRCCLRLHGLKSAFHSHNSSIPDNMPFHEVSTSRYKPARVSSSRIHVLLLSPRRRCAALSWGWRPLVLRVLWTRPPRLIPASLPALLPFPIPLPIHALRAAARLRRRTFPTAARLVEIVVCARTAAFRLPVVLPAPVPSVTAVVTPVPPLRP